MLLVEPAPLRGGADLPPCYLDTGIQTRRSALADRWCEYLAARVEIDAAAARLGKMVTLLGRFRRPPARVARKLRRAAVAMLEAVAAARRLRAVYQRAADVLLVATSWRGAESEGAFYGRIAYPLTLARAFAVVSFTAVRS